MAVMYSWRLVLLSALAAVTSAQNEYCRFTPQHTLCRFSGLGSACNQVQSRTVGAEERKYIVAEHNRLRAKVANGRETRGGNSLSQPPASNMRQLEWDEELARVAQRHAEQCTFQHDCRDCKRVARFKVGQNLYSSSSTRLERVPEWKRAVYAWYDEVALFDPNRIQPFVFETAIGHYTQMAWASTSRIGCGYTLYKEGPWWTKLYVCNYGAAGNFVRGQMYQRGAACGNCPAGTACSTDFPGLCADLESGSTGGSVPSPTPRPTRPPGPATSRPSPRPVTERPVPTVAPSQRPDGSSGQQLFACDLDLVGCRVKYGGTTWKIVRTKSRQRRILGTAVTFGRETELTFQTRITPPRSGLVCVSFAYMKYELRGSTPVPMRVALEPVAGGRAVSAILRDNARGQMRRVRVQMSDVQGVSELRFSAAVPGVSAGQATVVALDDIQVTSGRCQ